MNLPYEPGETVGRHYNRMVDYARTLDPRFVGGAASVREIARVEQAIVTLEKQAEEKAQRESDNNPSVIAAKRFSELWYRAHAARQAIVEMQETRLGQKSAGFDPRSWHEEKKMLSLPAEFFETPPELGGGPQDFKGRDISVEAARLEALAAKLNGFIGGWKAGADSQTRLMLRALFDRVQALEERLAERVG